MLALYKLTMLHYNLHINYQITQIQIVIYVIFHILILHNNCIKIKITLLFVNFC